MCPILPLDVFDAGRPDVGFVDESGSLQRVSGALSRHVSGSHAVQAPVHKLEQPFLCRLIATSPSGKKSRNLLEKKWRQVIPSPANFSKPKPILPTASGP